MNSYDLMIERYRKELMNASKRSSAAAQPPNYEPSVETINMSPSLSVDDPYDMNDETENNTAPLSDENEPAVNNPDPPSAASEPALNNTDPPSPSGNTAERYTGTLRIEVYAADRAYAIPSARVTVTRTDDPQKTPVFSGLTDISGVLNGIVLEAPSDSITQQPGILTGYASYDITVEHPRFRTQQFVGVPIFAGVESIQPVQMIPKNGENSPVIVREREPAQLMGKTGEDDAR